MQYGDLSSLAVEYPDYNSLGDTFYAIHKMKNNLTTSESLRFSKYLKLSAGKTQKLSDLAGRAIIVTLNKDLIAYGIIINETSSPNIINS